jgi:hypothetical protein
VPQGRDIRFSLPGRVDQLFPENTDDPVFSGVDFTDPVAVVTGGLNDAAGRGVDHWRYTAGLGIEYIFLHS